MADDTTTTSGSAEDRALDALTKILESAISPDMLEAQQIILRRLALAGDLFPARVPAPANITQIGGYLNLLEDQPELKAQVLAATLGVAGPNPTLAWTPALPALFFTTRANDRPEGAAQASIPVDFTIRSDFAGPFDAALQTIHDAGCSLPVQSAPRALPTIGSGAPPDDVLPFLGRTLDLVEATALVDPSTDALALAEPGAGGALEVVARQLDPAAPNAGAVSADDWNAWTCDATSCTQAIVHGSYLPLTPVMNAAGWYQSAPSDPVSLVDAGPWTRWTNVTGLVAGTSKLGDELSLLWSAGQIAQSSLREQLGRVWDGSAFVAA